MLNIPQDRRNREVAPASLTCLLTLDDRLDRHGQAEHAKKRDHNLPRFHFLLPCVVLRMCCGSSYWNCGMKPIIMTIAMKMPMTMYLNRGLLNHSFVKAIATMPRMISFHV